MFTFYYNQSGAGRKQFVKAISGILEVRPRYTGMPKCAYEMDFVTVTKEGNIEISDTASNAEVEEMIEKLGMMGYDHEPVEDESTEDEQPAEDEQPVEDEQPAEVEQPTEGEQSVVDEQSTEGEETDEDEQSTKATVDQLSEDERADDQSDEIQSIEAAGGAETEPADEIAMTISVSRSIMSDLGVENLKKLVHAKEDLLKQAFDIEKTDVEVTDEAISFPWFSQLSPEELKHASQFLSGLCRFANNSKRITSKRRREDNPKFAMRVWAIRMGFGGSEYKALRKYLMHRLSGDAAFRFGRPDDIAGVDPNVLPDAE